MAANLKFRRCQGPCLDFRLLWIAEQPCKPTYTAYNIFKLVVKWSILFFMTVSLTMERKRCIAVPESTNIRQIKVQRHQFFINQGKQQVHSRTGKQDQQHSNLVTYRSTQLLIVYWHINIVRRYLCHRINNHCFWCLFNSSFVGCS